MSDMTGICCDPRPRPRPRVHRAAVASESRTRQLSRFESIRVNSTRQRMRNSPETAKIEATTEIVAETESDGNRANRP